MIIIHSAKELKVYKLAYASAKEIFLITKAFPPEEKLDKSNPKVFTISG